MNLFKKVLRNNVIILCVAVAVGFVALVGVHLLPTDRMAENVYWSREMIEAEFEDELLLDGYIGTMTGNFTDCLMLQHAVYSGGNHSPLEQALRMFRSESCDGVNDVEEWWPGHSLMDYLDGVEQPREVEYARYWHGYLVVLKPLLAAVSFSTIRLLNGTCQLLLLGIILILCCRKKKESMAMAFLLSTPFLYFSSSYASLSLSICLYIMLVAVIGMLLFDEKIFFKGYYAEFFLLIGIATSYFDFLTYPLVTLVFPLAMYLYMHEDSWKNGIKNVFGYSVQWGIGYGGMWASKWVLSDVLTGSSTIKDALLTVGIRSQSAEGLNRASGFVHVVLQNLEPYMNWNFVMIFLVAIALLIWMGKRNGVKAGNVAKKGLEMLPLFAVAFLPFVWWFAMQNHSEQHFCFTCRIFAGAVFAGLLGLFRGDK